MDIFDIKDGIDQIDESDGFVIFHHLMKRFGWTGTVFSRGDYQSAIDREVSDDEWEIVKNSWYWTKGIQSEMTDAGWDTIYTFTNEMLRGE